VAAKDRYFGTAIPHRSTTRRGTNSAATAPFEALRAAATAAPPLDPHGGGPNSVRSVPL